MKGTFTRRTSLGTLAASAAALAAACGTQEGVGTSGGTAQKRDYNGTTLALWGSYGAAEREALLKFYDRFAQEIAPGLKTEVQI